MLTGHRPGTGLTLRRPGREDHRYRTDLKSGKRTGQTVYALTDLSHLQASPKHRGELGPLAVDHREQAPLVRDTSLGEDASRVRPDPGRENMATLRSDEPSPAP